MTDFSESRRGNRRASNETSVQAPLLDRLIDLDPDSSSDPQVGRARRLEELKASVRRDLEALLNTRWRCVSPPRDLEELGHSLVNYGLEDFTSADMASDDQREALRRAIEGAIRRNEPRLHGVSVTILDSVDGLDRTLRFRVEAVMRADQAPEPVDFDTVMEPVSRSFAIVG